MVTQTILFYFFFIVTFKVLNIEEHMHSGLLLATIFLFLTPAGLGWFERGQFTLYVCLAYLLLILGILSGKDIFIIASAFFAYVKWTSLPFVFVILVLYLLSARSRAAFIKNTRTGLLFTLVILLLSLAFRSRFLHFFEGLLIQESYELPSGTSMAQLLPIWIVKGMPLLCILWGYVCLRKNNMTFEQILPFLAGAGILMLTYPTVAFEYNIPSLLCFIPFLFYWTKQPGRLNHLIPYGLFLFIFLISNPNQVNMLFKGNHILFFYLLVSCALAVVPMLPLQTSPKQVEVA